MYEDIKRNKIKTNIVISIFLIMISFVVYFVCYMLDLGELSLIIAFVFSVISTFATYYNCDKIVLMSVRAREVTREEDLKLTNILDALMITADLPAKPRLYVVDSYQPNAFATGRNPENAVICVTTGLLEKLDYYELEGVIAHELAHIKNYDIRLSAVLSVMVGFVVMISDFCLRSNFRHRDNDDDSGKANAIALVIGLVFMILSPIVSEIIQLAVSRRREYLADATAISFTRNPDGLISALLKLENDDSELESSSKSNAHMYIVTPLKNKRGQSNIFSTHPSIADRVEALKQLS